MDDMSYRTAIRRNKPSAPMQFIVDNVSFTRSTSTDWLDYGCGRGDDLEFLRLFKFNLDGYDPHFKPERFNKKYDYISCTYVLNVLSPEDVNDVLLDIASLLKDDGRAFISVRNDVKEEGLTSIGTQQWKVKLDLEVLHRCGSFVLYTGSKDDIINSCN